MAERNLQSTLPIDSGLKSRSMRQRGQAAGDNNAKQAEGRENYESLRFDMDTGKLVVSSANEEQRNTSQRPAAPGRVVLNEMASQGFFIY